MKYYFNNKIDSFFVGTSARRRFVNSTQTIFVRRRDKNFTQYIPKRMRGIQ